MGVAAVIAQHDESVGPIPDYVAIVRMAEVAFEGAECRVHGASLIKPYRSFEVGKLGRISQGEVAARGCGGECRLTVG